MRRHNKSSQTSIFKKVSSATPHRLQHWGGCRHLLDEGLGQLVALGAVGAAVRLVDVGLLGVQLLLGQPGVQELHQLQAAHLLQQLGLKRLFVGLRNSRHGIQVDSIENHVSM